MKSFTLVEILLVMVLLSVATALSLPNLSKSFNQLQLQNTVNAIAFSMRYAQSLAITQNKKIRLEFSKNYTTYQLFEPNKQSLKEDFIPLTGRWGKINQIPSDTLISMEHSAITFFPNGEIDKTTMQICQKNSCLIISTHEQRGQIEVLDAN